MGFSNAQKGISKIYHSEILSIVAAILGVIDVIMLVILEKAGSDTSKLVFLGISVAVISIAVLLLLIIAFALNIIGLVNAGKDEKSFKLAIIFLVIGICSSFASNFFKELVPDNGALFSNIANSCESFFELLVSIFTIKGVMNVANKLGANDVEEMGSGTLKLMLVMYILIFILNILSVVFTLPSMAEQMAGVVPVILLVIAVFSLITYIIYIRMLGKAKRMF